MSLCRLFRGTDPYKVIAIHTTGISLRIVILTIIISWFYQCVYNQHDVLRSSNLHPTNTRHQLNENTPAAKFMQFAFDNADFNTRTLDGHGLFHVMGGITCATPAINITRDTPLTRIKFKEHIYQQVS